MKPPTIFTICWKVIKPYWQSEKKGEAWFSLMLLIMFLVLLAAINAYKTYLSKWAIDALEAHNASRVYQVLWLAAGSFVVSTLILSYKDYFQNSLVYKWRRWLNRNMLDKYLANETYYKMNLYSSIDNPDQRMAEDLREYVIKSVEYFANFFFSFLSICSLISILWMISPWLVLCIVSYAFLGTLVTLLVSKRLVKVNFLNIQFEANYRYNLMHVRDNVESIAFFKGVEREKKGLVANFNSVISNFFRLIKLQRNISFFTNAYTLYGALWPFVILTPSFIAGKIGIGTITQSVDIFARLLENFSVIINNFQGLSTYAAIVRRLHGFQEALLVQAPESSNISFCESSAFSIHHTTVLTPDLVKTLVKDLSLELSKGASMMIMGSSGCGKSSLLRAIAGLWKAGEGSIIRPPMKDIMFLPQKPYMLLGTLREQLSYPQIDTNISDETLHKALAMANMSELPNRVGGFDVTMDWSTLLSLGEQQRVIFTRLFLINPQYAILDESTSALDETNEALLYSTLRDSGMSYISVGHRSSLIPYHQKLLTLQKGGGWKITSL